MTPQTRMAKQVKPQTEMNGISLSGKLGHEATMFLAHTHTRTIKNTMNV